MIGIYKITSPNNKIYIGQSIDIENRVKKNYSKGLCKNQIFLYNSIKKYGWNNHKFEIVKECMINELNYLEKFYIKFYNSFNTKNGLNLRSGGSSTSKVSEITKEKMSKSWENGKRTNKSKELHNAARKINQYTIDNVFIRTWDYISQVENELGFYRSNICKACKGKCYSAYGYRWSYIDEEKTYNTMRMGMKQRIPVYQYSLNGEFIKKWDFVNDAAIYVNGSVVGINKCCHGIYKKAYKYIWSFNFNQKS